MKYTTKWNVSDTVLLHGLAMQITKISDFGGEPHYGFVAEGVNGWMPVAFVDADAVRIEGLWSTYRDDERAGSCDGCGWASSTHLLGKEPMRARYCPVL